MGVTLHGFAWDASSSYTRGAAQGPAAIRANLFSDHSSAYGLNGTDIAAAITEFSFNDLPADAAEARAVISADISQTIEAGHKPLSLGGDHSVSYPILKALAAKHGPINVLHIDAHLDLYDELDGDRFSHACPFRRAIEDGCIDQLIQVGIRSAPPAHLEWAAERGVQSLGSEQIGEIDWSRLTAPLYMTIDLDGLDPAFAPGVSHIEPGGLTSREVIGLIHKLPVSLVGADVVELNPSRDINLMTTHLAVRLVKELTAAMVG
jgi:agmatinase